MCKRRKKQKTRWPIYWRTFRHPDKCDPLSVVETDLPTGESQSSFIVDLMHLLSAGNRVLRFVASFTHYYWESKALSNCQLIAIAGVMTVTLVLALLMRRNNFLISGHTPCPFICASLINRLCIIPLSYRVHLSMVHFNGSIITTSIIHL